jgi:hypothetical protein
MDQENVRHTFLITQMSSDKSDGYQYHLIKRDEGIARYLCIDSSECPADQEKYLFRAKPSHLEVGAPHLHVLISTKSGTGAAEAQFRELILPALIAIGIPEDELRINITDSSDSIARFAKQTLLKEAMQGRKQTVLLLSGDGGTAEILNAVMEEKGDVALHGDTGV